MASREVPSTLGRLLRRDSRQALTLLSRRDARYASTAEAVSTQEVWSKDIQDLESHSSLRRNNDDHEITKAFDPVKRAKGRKQQLPRSRYQYRPPRYFRGPLHPHQPPPISDPSSRLFVPGPFYYNRLEQTYESTIKPDLMTLGYVHRPPGTVTVPKVERLRSWDDSSPYHKGRPKRGPRGPGEMLRLVEKDIDWRNIPRVEEVTIHSMVKGAIEDSAHLHVAGMMLQTITGVPPKVFKARQSVAQFGIREAMPIALTCTIRGDQAYEFVDKCIHMVFPRIKDWEGIKGSTGDSSGNISFGFDREGAILFPEVEVNYDMYPPKMIPGFHVTIKTSAKSDRHARLLLSAMGVPFYGKLVD